MNVLNLYLLLFFISLSSFSKLVAAQELQKPIPAAWVWEITGKSRVVYLVGEVHAFIGSPSPVIDYDLGVNIYDLATSVWVETDKARSLTQKNSRTLSSQVGSTTWENLGEALTSLLSYSRLSSSTKSQLHDKELLIMDNQSAGLTFISLSQLSYLKYALAVKNQNVAVPGLTMKLEALERQRNQKKIKYLEAETSIDEA